jgi:hypothetical protein
MSTPNNDLTREEQFPEKRRTTYDFETSQTADGSAKGPIESRKRTPENEEESAADINRKYRDNVNNDNNAGSDNAEAHDSDEPYDEQPMDGERAFRTDSNEPPKE